ncbi:hypothetical protein [Streptomyces sp. NPDC059649]|uniref:hypothetical protein n=1 Tax=Streptomyces sp. NPDC059649 TaxID=3346895 RepID=UPI0036C71ADC
MADSAEIVEPTLPTSGAAGPGGSARSAGPDRPVAASASIRLDNLTKRHPDSAEGHRPGTRGGGARIGTVAMALIMDWPGTLVELLLRPRGPEVD